MSDLPLQPAVQTAAFLPNGRRLYFSIPATSIADLIAKALELDAALTAAGLSVREPGLSEGEQRESIAYVVRRAKMNDDGTETPLIDLYPEKLAFKFLSIYLNTPEEIASFEAATGLHLNTTPVYASDTAIERFKNGKRDAEYVISLPKPAGVIWKANPRYEGENDKKHPKRMFVRWADVAAAPAPAAESTPELRVVEKPATPKNGNGATHPRLVELREKVHKEINKDLTDVQIAAYGGVKAFNDVASWQAKHGTMEKAFSAVKSEYEFEQLPSMVSEVPF